MGGWVGGHVRVYAPLWVDGWVCGSVWMCGCGWVGLYMCVDTCIYVYVWGWVGVWFVRGVGALWMCWQLSVCLWCGCMVVLACGWMHDCLFVCGCGWVSVGVCVCEDVHGGHLPTYAHKHTHNNPPPPPHTPSHASHQHANTHTTNYTWTHLPTHTYQRAQTHPHTHTHTHPHPHLTTTHPLCRCAGVCVGVWVGGVWVGVGWGGCLISLRVCVGLCVCVCVCRGWMYDCRFGSWCGRASMCGCV